MTLSALMAFICPKLTFPVTRPLSTSAVATAAKRAPCESHELPSQEEMERGESCRPNAVAKSRRRTVGVSPEEPARRPLRLGVQGSSLVSVWY